MAYLNDPVIGLTLGLGYALLFGLAVLHKFRDRKNFYGVLKSYKLLPDSLLLPAVTIIPLVELLIVCGLVFPETRTQAGVGAGFLLIVYAGAMGVNIVRDNVQLDCGCSFGVGKQTVSWGLVWRNVLLANLALILLIPSGNRPLGFYDWSAIAFAIIAASVLYTTANTLIEQQRFTKGLIS